MNTVQQWTGRLACAALVLGMTGPGMAQTKTFPDLVCEDLHGKRVALPQSHLVRPELIGILASERAADSLSSWYLPIYDNFAWDKETGVYFVILMGGMERNMSMTIQKRIKEAVPEENYHMVLLYKGNRKSALDALSIEAPDSPYFFTLDPKKQITAVVKGAYSEARLDQIIIGIDGEIEVNK